MLLILRDNFAFWTIRVIDVQAGLGLACILIGFGIWCEVTICSELFELGLGLDVEGSGLEAVEFLVKRVFEVLEVVLADGSIQVVIKCIAAKEFECYDRVAAVNGLIPAGIGVIAFGVFDDTFGSIFLIELEDGIFVTSFAGDRFYPLCCRHLFKEV